MALEFDDGVADRLVDVLNGAADELWDQGTTRSSAASKALQDFQGRYAQIFEDLCQAEAADRWRLKGVLEDLVPQVQNAKRLAAQEKQRQTDLAAWYEREAERAWVRATSPVGSVTSLSSELYDPKPSELSVWPPTLDAEFSIVSRVHSAAGSTGTSSADPQALREFVAQANKCNGALEEQLNLVRSAWWSFTYQCSWVHLGRVSFILGFQELVEQNREDALWAGRIADAFELAGSGGILNPFGVLSDVALSSSVELAQRYRGTVWVPGGADVLGELPPGITQPSAGGFAGRWFVLAPDRRSAQAASVLVGSGAASGVLRPKAVFTDNLNVGEPPRWARAGGRTLGTVGAGLTFWAEYSTSYNNTLTCYPDWTENERRKRAVGDGLFVGVFSVAGGAAGGAVLAESGALLGAAIGSVVPGLGTIAGAFIGGVIGAVVGGVVYGWVGSEAGSYVSGVIHHDGGCERR